MVLYAKVQSGKSNNAKHSLLGLKKLFAGCRQSNARNWYAETALSTMKA